MIRSDVSYLIKAVTVTTLLALQPSRRNSFVIGSKRIEMLKSWIFVSMMSSEWQWCRRRQTDIFLPLKSNHCIRRHYITQ